jgi:integrase
MASTNLWRRGNQWWHYVAVPAPLRKHFLSSNGRPQNQIREPLGDTSSAEAEYRASQRVAVIKRVFARLQAGEKMSPERVKAALNDEIGYDPEEDRVIDHKTDWSQVDPQLAAMRRLLRMAKRFEDFGDMPVHDPSVDAIDVTPAPAGETVTKAADAWFLELARDSRPETVDGHKRRVQAFVKQRGDMVLTDVTVAMAAEFLRSLDVANGTRNAYATTLKCVFEDARKRGLFTGENPFDDQKVKRGGDSYAPFTIPELQTLFDAMPRTVAPARHSPETALPWVALVALHTGARLEEICQLTTADVREENANGGTVWVIDIHNGGDNKLKNESAARLVPVHSELARHGFLDYVRALPAGPLFPGLRRGAKGKLGEGISQRFRKLLVRLGLKRDMLTFHSFRHTVAGRLDAAGVPQSDAARILGHAVAGMSYGTYSQAGPGLKRIAGVVEEITYEGLGL